MFSNEHTDAFEAVKVTYETLSHFSITAPFALNASVYYGRDVVFT